MFAVTIEPSALRDIAQHYAYLQEHAHSPEYPDIWYDSIVEAIAGLGDFPRSFGAAPESTEFVEELRHRIVGSYRILFTVADRVSVLHVRHCRQDVLRP